jgi:hypothetical protein
VTFLEIVFIFNGRAEDPDFIRDLMSELVIQPELSDFAQCVLIIMKCLLIAAVVFMTQRLGV